ncbi:MAG: zinc ABC transporter substrate-binding protein [Gemmatimonadota bacterium]
MKPDLHRTSLLPTIVLALTLAGCGADAGGGGDLSERSVRAVATTSVVADLVREVGGDRVEVIGLMGPGVDPHLYRASEGDVRRMMEADIVFFNGLHLEGRMGEIFEQMNSSGRPTVAVAEATDRSSLLNPPEFEGAYDPHVWMDVGLWLRVVPYVGEALAELDPVHAAEYRSRAAAYVDRLSQLDAYVREQTGRLPEERRVLITAHDAFNYFGEAYGFEVRGLQGISTVAEAGTADVQELAEFVAARRIPALFIETSVSPRSIEAVQAAVRSRGFGVEVGGNLYSDALGGPGTGAETYEGMIRHNAETIVTALLRDVE